MIPENWRRQLYANELITCIGHWLHYLGEHQSPVEQQTQRVRVPREVPAANHPFQHQQLRARNSLQNEAQKATAATGLSGYGTGAPWSYTKPNSKFVNRPDPYVAQKSGNKGRTINTEISLHGITPTAGLPSHYKTVGAFGYGIPPNYFGKRAS
ncbi:unnamed protein product [Rotaria socialis]|nr:unnamed protein product [Rotaria socialis]